MQKKLVDILDIDVLKALFESFSTATGTVTAVLDLDGHVLVSAGWQDICLRFHRANPETARRCLESDTHLAGQLEAGKSYTVYECRNGLIDVAVPIKVGGSHVGNLFTGQFFFEPPDPETFRKQAVEFGFDEAGYLGALERVPVLSRDHVFKTLDFLTLLATAIGEMGMAKLRSDAELAERGQAEQALQASERQKRLIIETVPDLVWLKDVEGTFLACNKMFERFYGASETEIVGKTDYDFVDKELADFFRMHDKAAMDADRPLRNEERITFADDGHSVLLETTKTPLKDEDGKVLGVLGIGRDITERVAAETALRESQERFQSALEHIPDVVTIYGRDRRIRFVNPAAERVTGRPASEFLGRRDEEILPEEACSAYLPILQKAFDTGKACSGDVELSLREGASRQVKMTCVPVLDQEGAVREVVGITHDYTEHKRMEAQLRQTQKMEAVGQLTGGLAHDLNNTLGIILMNADMLRLSVADIPEVSRHFDLIMNSIMRARDLTRKLLDFSRRDAGKTARVVLGDFVSGVRDLIGKSLTPAIALEIVPGVGIWEVEIDPGDFEAALLNLAINARDAMPEGGALVIETANKVVDDAYVARNPGSAAGEFVMVSVSDTGTGMTPRTLEKAFEPFFTTKAVGKGSGLGLSMVYGFVQRSGGHVKIYSEEGKGTNVRMYLPRAAAGKAGRRLRPDDDEKRPRGSEAVLVVDDEEELGETAVLILKRLGYRTRSATSGAQALEAIEQDPSIDLLFSDVIMPGGMDGYQLALRARAVRPDLRVLLTSGFTPKREELVNGDNRIVADLAKNLLNKPYNVNELAVAIRTALDRPVE